VLGITIITGLMLTISIGKSSSPFGFNLVLIAPAWALIIWLIATGVSYMHGVIDDRLIDLLIYTLCRSSTHRWSGVKYVGNGVGMSSQRNLFAIRCWIWDQML